MLAPFNELNEPMTLQSWARFMSKMQARACIVSRVTGLSGTEARRIWKMIFGRSSPSGQQPTDFAWFLKTPERRSHAALLLMLYQQAQEGMPEYADFSHAYYHYGRMTGGNISPQEWQNDDPAFRMSEKDYVIPFSRGHFLALTYTDDLDRTGVRKCPLQLRRCKSCGGIYLAHWDEAQNKCPVHDTKQR